MGGLPPWESKFREGLGSQGSISSRRSRLSACTYLGFKLTKKMWVTTGQRLSTPQGCRVQTGCNQGAATLQLRGISGDQRGRGRGRAGVEKAGAGGTRPAVPRTRVAFQTSWGRF